jgi:hypothetical protein
MLDLSNLVLKYPTQNRCHIQNQQQMRRELELTKLHLERVNRALGEFKEF